MKQSLWLTGLGSTTFDDCIRGLYALQDLARSYLRNSDVQFSWDINHRVGTSFPAIQFQNRLFSVVSDVPDEHRVQLHHSIDPSRRMQGVWEGSTLVHVQDNVVEYYERAETKHGGRQK